MLDVDKFPLYWPESWPRTQRREGTTRYSVTFSDARDRLFHSLKLLGATEIVLSTNIPIRRSDGLPVANVDPVDPGVAVYWVERASKEPRVIACDHWTKVRDNMRATGLAIEALRTLKRSGASQVIAKVYTGFAALAASNPTSRPWRVVFGWENLGGPTDSVSWTEQDVKQRFKELLLERHPDRGGSAQATHELTRARDEAFAELRAIP